MAALDASIILSGNQQKQDPLATVGNALNLSHAIENQRATRDERGRQDLLRQATVIGPDGQIDERATMANLVPLVGPDVAGKISHQFQSDRLARDKSTNDNKKAALERAEKNMNMVANSLAALGPEPSLADLHREAYRLKAQGLELDVSQLPDEQALVPGFMQQMQAQVMGVKDTLANHRADYESNFKVQGPQTDAAKSAYDSLQYQNGGWNQFGGNPSEFGALRYAGVPMPTGQPANAMVASPQGANGQPAAPGGIEIAAPEVPVHDYRNALHMAAINKAYGDPDKIAEWDPQGNRRMVPEVIAAKKDIGKSSANRNIVNVPYEKEIRKQRAQATAEIQKEARAATKNARDVQLMVESLGDLEGGPLAAKIQSVNQFFPWAKDVTNRAQLADAIAARLGPAMRVLGSGSTSDYEARQALQALPTLSMYKEGRAVLNHVFTEIAKRARYEADVRDKIAGSDNDENMEQRVEQAMKEKFGDSLLSKEQMALVEEHTKGRKAKSHNVQPAPAAAPPKEMDFKDWSKQ
jgi:hypothetical protein